MKTITNITDFGKKIGGAKKDLWRERNLLLSDITNFDDVDKKNFIKKDLIWKKPDYQKMKDEGKNIVLIYFIKTIRDAIPCKPVFYDDTSIENYISGINYFENALMSMEDCSEIESFYKDKILNASLVEPISLRYVNINQKYSPVINNKVLKAAQTKIRILERDIQKKKFLFTEEDIALSNYVIRQYSSNTHFWEKDGFSGTLYLAYKVGGSTYFMYPKDALCNESCWKENTWYVVKNNHRDIVNGFETYEAAKEYILTNTPVAKTKKRRAGKKRYAVKKLENLSRVGDNLDSEIPEEFLRYSGEDILNKFDILGGEFGTWVSDDEKQLNLNWAYLSFSDLAEALNIPYKSISIGNRLSIAFGSRGSGSALAHYEVDREVINLTRMKGAGSLAHEWGHAVDFISKSILGFTEYYQISEKLFHSFKYKNKNLRNSRKL